MKIRPQHAINVESGYHKLIKLVADSVIMKIKDDIDNADRSSGMLGVWAMIRGIVP